MDALEFVESLADDEIVVGTEYIVCWDDDSSTEGGFRATLLERGNDVTLWSNGVLLCGRDKFCYSLPVAGCEAHDPYLLERMRRK